MAVRSPQLCRISVTHCKQARIFLACNLESPCLIAWSFVVEISWFFAANSGACLISTSNDNNISWSYEGVDEMKTNADAFDACDNTAAPQVAAVSECTHSCLLSSGYSVSKVVLQREAPEASKTASSKAPPTPCTSAEQPLKKESSKTVTAFRKKASKQRSTRKGNISSWSLTNWSTERHHVATSAPHPSAIQLQGSLYKLNRGAWKKRWFLLRESSLFYFHSGKVWGKKVQQLTSPSFYLGWEAYWCSPVVYGRCFLWRQPCRKRPFLFQHICFKKDLASCGKNSHKTRVMAEGSSA